MRLMIDDARALGIGRGRIARAMRADDLAAAAAQRVVLAAGARRARIAPAAERAERIGRVPVAAQLGDPRSPGAGRGGRRRSEAARGELAAGLGADQESPPVQPYTASSASSARSGRWCASIGVYEQSTLTRTAWRRAAASTVGRNARCCASLQRSSA